MLLHFNHRSHVVPSLLYLWSFPLDHGRHLQLSQGEVIVHEQSVPAALAEVCGLQRHFSAQEVRQPAAGLRAEQLVGAHRVHVIFQRRKRAFGRHTQRLYHVRSGICSSEPFVLSETRFRPSGLSLSPEQVGSTQRDHTFSAHLGGRCGWTKQLLGSDVARAFTSLISQAN